MPRLTKIFTRKGDDGFTTLGDNRLSKDDFALSLIYPLGIFVTLISGNSTGVGLGPPPPPHVVGWVIWLAIIVT